MPAEAQPGQQATAVQASQTQQHPGLASHSSDKLPAGLDRQVFVFKREATLAHESDTRYDCSTHGLHLDTNCECLLKRETGKIVFELSLNGEMIVTGVLPLKMHTHGVCERLNLLSAV